MKSITYSVIIPHKNVPNLLQRCLDSIPLYEGLEIIIIDDNSDTIISNIDCFPGVNRKDTKVFFLEESHGAGFARNYGVQQAAGKWLLFADADDFYTENLRLLLDKYKNDTDTDIVFYGAQIVSEDTDQVVTMSYLRYIKRYNRGKKFSNEVLRYNTLTPWSRMVKKSLVNQYSIVFDEIPVGNDQMFTVLCGKYANSIKAEEFVVYNYFKPKEGSVTERYQRNLKYLPSRLDLQNRIITILKNEGYPFLPSFIYRYLRSSEKSKEIRDLYSVFMKRNSITLIEDFKNMIILIIGRSFKII